MLREENSMIKRVLSLTVCLAVVFSLFILFEKEKGIAADTVVSQNGQLKVVGAKLSNQNGVPVQLKGMSSHGLQWFGNYMNKDSIKWLKDDWGITLIRAAMYTAEGGYIANPTPNKEKVKEIVNAAIELGIYVIIDWHILADNDPNTYKSQSIAFFKEMATLYGTYPNVIYEICNEPNGAVTWNGHIKPYAEAVIPEIRKIDPDGIIIVGTGTWSQDVHHAADNQLSYSNIMYACHFYAGSHTQWLRDRVTYAMGKGAAIFVTEWGTSDASGNGGVYLSETQKWTDFMAANKISWANWSLCDKAESSASLVSGASARGGWTDANLTTSGKFVKSKIREGISSNPTPQPTAVTVPTATKVPSATATKAPIATATSVPTVTKAPAATATPVQSGTGSGTLKVQFYNGVTSGSSNQIAPKFKLINTGSTPVNLADVKLRYYYSIDGDKAQNFYCDWASLGSANVTGRFVKMPVPAVGADYYLEIGFASTTASLSPGASADIQVRFSKSDWSNYTQTGDYSFNATAANYADWNKVAAYNGTQLVFGTNP